MSVAWHQRSKLYNYKWHLKNDWTQPETSCWSQQPDPHWISWFCHRLSLMEFPRKCTAQPMERIPCPKTCPVVDGHVPRPHRTHRGSARKRRWTWTKPAFGTSGCDPEVPCSTLPWKLARNPAKPGPEWFVFSSSRLHQLLDPPSQRRCCERNEEQHMTIHSQITCLTRFRLYDLLSSMRDFMRIMKNMDAASQCPAGTDVAIMHRNIHTWPCMTINESTFHL